MIPDECKQAFDKVRNAIFFSVHLTGNSHYFSKGAPPSNLQEGPIYNFPHFQPEQLSIRLEHCHNFLLTT